MEFALRLGVHGLIPQAADIVDLTSHCGYVDLQEFHLYGAGGGLLFAFEVANTWPSVIPEDHRTSEYLSIIDEENWMTKQAYRIIENPDGIRPLLTSD